MKNTDFLLFFGLLSASLARAEVCPIQAQQYLESLPARQLNELMADYAAKAIAYPSEATICRGQVQRISLIFQTRAASAKSQEKYSGPTVSLDGIGMSATGKRASVIDAAVSRISKRHPRPACPVLTDSELEALILDSRDQNLLWQRYAQVESNYSTLGAYTDTSVMRSCEQQSRRILFFWNTHKIAKAKALFS